MEIVRLSRWMRIVPLIMIAAAFPLELNSKTISDMEEYYCEYCGHKFPNVRLLASTPCHFHPLGENKGMHKLYEGGKKSEYICKYCGRKFPSILVMAGYFCAFHPNGSNKGRHSPAL